MYQKIKKFTLNSKSKLIFVTESILKELEPKNRFLFTSRDNASVQTFFEVPQENRFYELKVKILDLAI